MKQLLSLAIAIMVFGGQAAFPSVGSAGDKANIIILGEDASRGSMPRESRVFKGVLSTISAHLSEGGFKVFDEMAVASTLYSGKKSRRTDADIIEIARSIRRPPIDVGVIFSIYSYQRDLSFVTRLNTSVEGRLVNIRTGQRLGNFEMQMPEAERISDGCDSDCLMEYTGRQAKDLAQDLGVVLTMKLNRIFNNKPELESGVPKAFTLTFRNFRPGEITEIEEYISAFNGYRKHRILRSLMRMSEYLYETESGSTRLNRNFRLMLDHLQVKGTVNYSGDKFIIKKIR